MNKSRRIGVAIIVLAIGITGCEQKQASPAPAAKSNAATFDLAAARKVIDENNARFTKAHVTGDGKLIDSMFTKDARSLPPESAPVIGVDAISKLTAQYLASGVSEFTEVTTDFYGNQDLLIDQGDYVMVYGKEKTREKGKYVNVWKKEDGVWKIYSNIWNTNAPAAPAK